MPSHLICIDLDLLGWSWIQFGLGGWGYGEVLDMVSLSLLSHTTLVEPTRLFLYISHEEADK